MVETWKPIFGFPAYEISNMGNCRGFYRGLHLISKCIQTGVRASRWRSSRRIYYSLTYNNKRYRKYASHLVAEAFIGPRPKGLFCLHKDDNSTNNKEINLYYGTQKQNDEDRIRNGGYKYPLSWYDEMRELHVIGCSNNDLAKFYEEQM